MYKHCDEKSCAILIEAWACGSLDMKGKNEDRTPQRAFWTVHNVAVDWISIRGDEQDGSIAERYRIMDKGQRWDHRYIRQQCQELGSEVIGRDLPHRP